MSVFRHTLELEWSDTALTYSTPTDDGVAVFRVDVSTGEKHQLPSSAAPKQQRAAASPTGEAVRLSLSGLLCSAGGPAIDTSIRLVNSTSQTVRIVWIDYDGRRAPYGELIAGTERIQPTYVGHVWAFVFEDIVLCAAAAVARECVRMTLRSLEPDGGEWVSRERAFVRGGNLFLRVDGDDEVSLTRGATKTEFYEGLFFSKPDARWLLALHVQKAPPQHVTLVESSPNDSVQPKLVRFEYPKAGDAVDVVTPHLFDLDERRRVPLDGALFPEPWNVSGVTWVDGSFCFVCNERSHQLLRLMRVDVPTGRVSVVVEETSETFIDYQQAWHHFLTDKVLWLSERSGWRHIYSVSLRTYIETPITSGEWVVQRVIDADEQHLVLSVAGRAAHQSPYHLHVARVNTDGSEFRLLTDGDGTHEAFFSPDRRFFVDKWSRVDLAPRHELRRTADGAKICDLEVADDSALLEAGWLAPERAVAKGRDGITDIHGIIVKPRNFRADRTYPVLENVYAGPHGAHTPVAWRDSYGAMSALADLGFIVVQADGMGTTMRGKRFHDVCFKNLQDAGFPDRIAWLKLVAASRPYMNVERGVGIFGGSAGGQTAMRALIDHNDFYVAAVADCGCHDNRLDKQWWNEQWLGPDIADPAYEAASNVVHAHRLQGKLLLMVGELDQNVDPASTMQAVNALVRADKDFEMLVVPGAGHGVAETRYGARKRAEFFVRHMLQSR